MDTGEATAAPECAAALDALLRREPEYLPAVLLLRALFLAQLAGTTTLRFHLPCNEYQVSSLPQKPQLVVHRTLGPKVEELVRRLVCARHHSIEEGNTLAERLAREAAAGTHAQFFVGLWAYYVRQDSLQAPRILRALSEAGHAGAMYTLGVLYMRGSCGIPGDKKEGLELMCRAEKAGHIGAANSLAVFYENGKGEEQDLMRAVVLYSRAAAGGHAGATYNLALCFLNGRGVPQDQQRAVALLDRAADAGDADALRGLALCFRDGVGVAVPDLAAAAVLLARAGERGSTDALNDLAEMYLHGHGVEEDHAKAAALFRRAADAGHATALFNLALCVKRGWGVEKDVRQAVALYRLALDLF
eukprot:TRINITY_DN2969_c0_g1_i1.p1 TRINITY_DN2969_c0_g1~~TRINITY_DN2969_c0_g1_i1.p1  ORF type:complete len:404 (-),score=105.21 TRINITY_DN2969_c0_g1_i1:67-1146(-)